MGKNKTKLRKVNKAITLFPSASCLAIAIIFNTELLRGHAGIAVQTSDGWLLHAGDAYFYRDEIGFSKRRCTPGLRAYQWMMEVDRKARLYNQEKLRALSCDGLRPACGDRSSNVRLFCSHDAIELKSFTEQNNPQFVS
ncbi:hypothetical protein [Nostoc sp. MS1]|uniref:hypothetical protein n=1 Tax=Nostoc sp. MS1 TaxID=2764711 RepID=UPI001CC51628|nr:hypothetical protein [Nostoc sp. MS1]